MNKERAKEIINTEVIDTLKSHQQMSACFDYDDDGNAKPNNNYAYYDELLQALDIAIESLEQDQETKEKMWAKQLNECEECEVINNEWVDVRDRLPSESGWYIVTVDEYADGKHIFVDTCTFYNGTFGSYPTDNIIAWRPLLQPYERNGWGGRR